MNHDDLIQRFLEGKVSPDEVATLSQLIETDAIVRIRYLDFAELHASLLADEALRFQVSAQPAPSSKMLRWITWRPLMAAAAGLVFGMFCTSVVFAYVGPSLGKVITLLHESFEFGPPPLVLGVPIEAGKWSGDFTEVESEQQSVKPESGKKMLRFLRADYEGKKNADGYVADLHQLIDLRPYKSEFADGGAVVQLSAGFNAFEFPMNEKYACLMSLHALDAETVRSGTLSSRQTLNADALAMTSNNREALDRNPTTWQHLTAELRLPPGTEFLLIHVGVTHATKTQQRATFDWHYLDEVRLVLTRRAPLP